MANVPDVNRITEAVDDLLAALPPSPLDITGLSTRKLQSLRQHVLGALVRLQDAADELDTIKQPGLVFDPTHPTVIGELIGRTLIAQDRVPLGAVEAFYGSGVYALYFKGEYDAYAPISRTDTPIYVGKADPADRYAITARDQEARLARRLNDHKRSIVAATNLDIDDFECRFLVVKTAWEGTAEDYLINFFKPVWNNEMNVCKGFGKHGDDAKTRSNTRSPWDTLHPGRKWATKEGNVPNPLGVKGIKQAITEHFNRHPPRFTEQVVPPSRQRSTG